MSAPAGLTQAATERGLIVAGVPDGNGCGRTLPRGQRLEAGSAGNGSTDLAVLRHDSPGLYFLDRGLPDLSALDIPTEIRSRSPDAAAVMMTRVGTNDVAAQALVLGTGDFSQAFSGHDFRAVARRAWQRIRHESPWDVDSPPLHPHQEAFAFSARADLRTAGRHFGGVLHPHAPSDEGGFGLWPVFPVVNRRSSEGSNDNQDFWTIEKQFEP